MPAKKKPVVKTESKPVSAVAGVLKSLKKGDTAPHLIVEARAGTGKTTTLVEGLKRVKGLPSTLVPSPQQAAVWDSMALSAGKVSTICMVAFNKSIATELQSRVPQGVDAMTMHSMGFKAVQQAFGRVNVVTDRVQNIISDLLGKDIRELRRYQMEMVKGVQDLVGLCKMNLVNVGSLEPNGLMGTAADEALEEIVTHYSLELNGSRSQVFDLVPKVLAKCKEVDTDKCVDFNDMIWIPAALGLTVFKYDLLLVDESQDLNRCQQALAKRAGNRLIMVGDPKQAIYGFAGADSESMPRMARELGETDRGCVTLPLTVTRRCGKAIVVEANQYVSDFGAFESNPEGRISKSSYKPAPCYGCVTTDGNGDNSKPCPICKGTKLVSYQDLVEDGDMILCRVNAPLVSQCFKFLRAGRKANIQGRDVGQGLISTIKRLHADSIPDLMSKLSDWKHNETTKENAKRTPSDTRLIAIQDRYDCLCCFMEDAETVDEVIGKIDRLFTDDRSGTGIRLSSVHKAKGLEAKRVFILRIKGAEMPHPMAKTKWQKEQEINILYVAITRAIEELVYVS